MFPKPPYRVELHDAHGEDNKQALLGMPADGDWVLRNPHSDKALIRDAFFYGLGREMGFSDLDAVVCGAPTRRNRSTRARSTRAERR